MAKKKPAAKPATKAQKPAAKPASKAKKPAAKPAKQAGKGNLRDDGIDVTGPATTTTNKTDFVVDCECGGFKTPVIITLTTIPPAGPPLAAAITPLMFHCGDT